MRLLAQPAYLCTPTDVHVIPQAAHAAAKSQNGSLGPVNLLCKATGNLAMTLTSNVKPAVVAADGSSLYLVDGLVNAQGPNYALAKRMQHWRAVVARQEYRCMVSSNIAPSTATASVVSNRLFAMAYGGMRFFRPMEVRFVVAAVVVVVLFVVCFRLNPLWLLSLCSPLCQPVLV